MKEKNDANLIIINCCIFLKYLSFNLSSMNIFGINELEKILIGIVEDSKR